MEPLTWLVVLPLIAVGLFIAAAAQKKARLELLERLGFSRRDHTTDTASSAVRYEGTWKGHSLTLTPQDKLLVVDVPLPSRPISYGKLVRALGRGELLARLFDLDATTSTDRLTGRWPRLLRAANLRARLDAITHLAESLSTLPAAEALARHVLECAEHDDPIALFSLLLTSYPDTPETLAVCKNEVTTRRHPELAGLAERHLNRPAPANSAADSSDDSLDDQTSRLSS